MTDSDAAGGAAGRGGASDAVRGLSDPDRLAEALRAVALRVEAARRISPTSRTAVLRSIVEATAALFAAEAASIALHDPATGRLVFEVAAGEQGQGVIGLDIDAGQGVAGYVFSTGQPIALADDEGIVGVLEVLDKRGDGGFDLRDLELAGVFARQATVAIRSSRLERDTAELLRAVLGAAGDPANADDVDTIVGNAVAGLDADGSDPLWALADEIARLAATDPAQLDLVRELLAVLVRRAGRASAGRSRAGRPR